jgi:hypothetical protein
MEMDRSCGNTISYTDVRSHAASLLRTSGPFRYELLAGSALAPPHEIRGRVGPDVAELRREWLACGLERWVDGEYVLTADAPVASPEQALELVAGCMRCVVARRDWGWEEIPAGETWRGSVSDGRRTREFVISRRQSAANLAADLRRRFGRRSAPIGIAAASESGALSWAAPQHPLCPHCLVPAMEREGPMAEWVVVFAREEGVCLFRGLAAEA